MPVRMRAGGAGTPTPTAVAAPAEPPQRPRGRAATCASRCAVLALLVALLCCGGLVGSAAWHGRTLSRKNVLAPVNFFFMRLARDLSRVKARRRKFNQEGALMPVLMPVLMGREEPLPLADAADVGIALTAEELAEFDGRFLPDSIERSPLYLAIRGRIYDVSAAWSFYGPGKSYYGLVGRDATRAFCTGCLDEPCLISSMHGLTEAQRKEADRWVELYEHHDKYRLVGIVREAAATLGEAEAPASADEPTDEWEQEQLRAAQHAEGAKTHKPFRPPV